MLSRSDHKRAIIATLASDQILLFAIIIQYTEYSKQSPGFLESSARLQTNKAALNIRNLVLSFGGSDFHSRLCSAFLSQYAN